MNKRVIIVEDEPNIAESLNFILKRAGYDVKWVDDGNDAVFEIQNSHPDVVVLDVMLPNRSGLEILRDIRSARAIAQTPVLMLSAKGQTKDVEIAIETGANDYIVKPFSNSKVLAKINELAEQ